MRRFHIVFIAGIVVLAGVVGLLVWQLRVRKAVRQDLEKSTAELKESATMSMKLTQLEKQIEVLKRKEEALYRQVPAQEQYPHRLLKALSAAAENAHFSGVMFSVKSNRAVSDNQPGQEEAPAMVDPGADPAAGKKGGERAGKSIGKGTAREIYLQMECDGDFCALLEFLDAVNAMERIVKVGRVTVERRKEIHPRQKIILDLVAYTL